MGVLGERRIGEIWGWMGGIFYEKIEVRVGILSGNLG